MTNPCFVFGQIHTNNATLVGVTSRCGAGDHIGFTPPLPHKSSPTCICIQPTNNIFCISVFVIDTDQAKQTPPVFAICIISHPKNFPFI